MIHILLIEDDAQRRRTAAEALRALDYDVIPAAGPEEALAALFMGQAQRSAEPIATAMARALRAALILPFFMMISPSFPAGSLRASAAAHAGERLAYQMMSEK